MEMKRFAALFHCHSRRGLPIVRGTRNLADGYQVSNRKRFGQKFSKHPLKVAQGYPVLEKRLGHHRMTGCQAIHEIERIL